MKFRLKLTIALIALVSIFLLATTIRAENQGNSYFNNKLIYNL